MRTCCVLMLLAAAAHGQQRLGRRREQRRAIGGRASHRTDDHGGARGRPAAGVLDVRLGGMSGIELAQVLAASDGQRAPVIYITAHDDPETRAIADIVPADNCLGYGFDAPGADFMGKDLQLEAGGVVPGGWMQ